nr:hypothetical protein [Tanacetum cinerariifolium]
MYGKPPGVELQELVNMFPSCKQAEGQSVSDHVQLMKSYLDQLATLNYAFPDKVSIIFILNSLSSEFQAFVQNYNMQSMEKTISEVHSLFIEFEKRIKRNKQPIVGASSTPQVMAIQAELMKKKKKTEGQNVASTSSGIYTIELFAFLKNSWVYDTGCGTHICNTKQGLRGAKKLKRGSLYLYMGNGVFAKVEAIGSFDLVLPNGLIIVLDNCHYAPSITRGVVSVSRLDEDILASENTSEHPIEEESLAPIVSQEEYVILVRRSMALNNAQTKTNSLAFKSMREKHQLTGPNFNEWFRTLKLVVRTVACLMLGTMSPKLYQQFEHNSPMEMVTELQKMYEKPPGVELQELVNMFPSCKQTEGQSVSDHVQLMRSYLDQLATLNYAFPDKVSIIFILNSLSSEFQAFVQNYNMQSMEKTISEVHSLFIEFKKRIKRNNQPIVGASSTPQVMAIQGGRVQKYKPQGKAKRKGKCKGPQNSYPTKPKKPHPYKKEPELMKKKKTGGQNVASTSSGIYTIELFAFLKNSWVYDTGCGTHICNTKQGLRGAKKLKRGSLYLKTINAIRSDRGGEYISQEFKDYLKACGIVQQLTPPYTPQHNNVFERRNRTLLNMVRSMMSLATLPLSFWDYALESAARILNMVPTKKVDKTPYELWHEKVPNLSYLKVCGCEAHVKRHTSDKFQQISIKYIFVGYPKETMGYYFYYPPENKIVVERSVRTHKAPDRLCLNVEIDPDRLCFNVEVEEHSLGDLNEPANYKVALSDPEFEKWIVAMNAEMQSMYDNKVWRLVVLPPNAKVVKSKWIYKKKTDMDGKVKTYLGKCFSMKDLGEAAFILGIKIYRDRSRRLIEISQNAYLDKILKRYRMDNSKRGSIPIQIDLHLSKSKCATTSAEMKRMQNVPYASAVGSIMYAVRCTRPDVAFAQNITNRFQQNSGEAHWTDVKNILKYLRNTKDTFLVYGGDPDAELRVNCYCDARFKTDRNDTKSQTGMSIEEISDGLKQSPRAWFGRFTLAMKRYGFKQSNSDHTLFLKNRKNHVTCLIIYVDDMVIAGNDEEEIKRLKEGLFTEFEMKDLGNLIL